MDDVRASFFALAPGDAGTLPVDDLTCADLGLDDVFEKINRARTGPGKALLYSWLRRQCAGPAALERRRRLIRAMREDPCARERARKILGKVGPQRKGDLAREIFGEPGAAFLRHKWKFHAYYAAMIAAIALGFALNLQPFLVAIGFMVANHFIFMRTTRYVGEHTANVLYLGAMLAALPKLEREVGRLPGFEGIGRAAPLAKILPSPGPLFQQNAGPFGDLLGTGLDYLRIFLLLELQAYFRFYGAFMARRAEVAEAFAAFGEVDAAAAVAILEEEGELREAAPRTGHRGLRVDGAVHPLLPGCVPNSLACEGSLVVTGTNMAGKTTFLRTLGINQILATTLGLAGAERFETGFYRVLSSIKIEDSLLEGKSRYFFEAERLLLILRESAGRPTLALVDEILAGTNSIDRIAASIAILGKFARDPGEPASPLAAKSLIVASTHELEVARALSGRLESFHFAETLGPEGLAFDYTLHPGIVDDRNALRILERLGFGEYIEVYPQGSVTKLSGPASPY